jgi:choice-of-anchor B domain-containing protein
MPRAALLTLLALLAVSGVLGAVAFGSDPDAGSVSLDQTATGWNGKHFALGVTPARQLCDVSDQLCDRFELTVDVDESHWDSHAGGVQVTIQWPDEADDFDLYVLDSEGAVVGSSAVGGTTSERVLIEKASGTYQVVVSPYQVTDGDYKGGAYVESRADVPAAAGAPDQPLSGVRCEGGKAGPFPCRNVDLDGFLPVTALNDGEATDTLGDPVELNDIWGWTDAQTGREYALVGKTNGTAFVDVTDPKAPRYLGSLRTHHPVETLFKTWRDIKVYKDHAYIVSEEPLHGMQVFDLTRLRGVTAPKAWTEDAHYPLVGNTHNIAINEESGFAYLIGTSTCQGGPHIVDIRNPKLPLPAGCVFQDGYTHDTQCVNYDGPDERFHGREICFNSNEDTVTIVDVTDKLNPVQLSRTGYDGAAYTHQGWLTADGRYFLMNDELDEQESGAPTTTRIFDVSRLDSPILTGQYRAKVASIDHNLYTRGDRVFEANYRSGLRVLDGSDVASGRMSEVGFFDVYPADDEAEFNGAWSNYPYFASGTVVVSGIEQGLFVLRPTGDAAVSRGAAPAAPAAPSAGAPVARAASASGPACTPTTAAKIARRGRALTLSFTPASKRVRVDVLRQTAGSRLVSERRVGRFTARSGKATWSGRGLRDGIYVLRYRDGAASRRVVVERRRGRFVQRPAAETATVCGLIRRLAVDRPVFGGRGKRALVARYRLGANATVKVEVLRGRKVVKRFKTAARRAGRTYTVRLPARGLRRGDHRVRVTAEGAGAKVTSSVVGRRL